MVLFKNPRDRQQIVYLARQVYPNNVSYMLAAFEDATTEPYGYLFVDLNPSTPEEIRLRTHIFPQDYKQMTVYQPST